MPHGDGCDWDLSPGTSDEVKMHEYLIKMDACIEKYGWAAQGVVPVRHGDTPWMYTVGFRPDVELCVLGLGVSTGHGMLKTAVAADVHVPGDYGNVLGGDYLVRVIEVNPNTDDFSFSLAMRWRARHGNEPWGFTALQILWPDVARRFPGDDHYDKEAFNQPVIQAAS